MTNVARQFRDQIRTEPQKVFVYGTLKKGFGNHERFLKGCKDLGIAAVDGLMFHTGAYPAINLGENFTKISGEVYEVDWDHILNMDSLEGIHYNHYDRVQVQTKSHGLVWTYIYPYERARKEQYVIPSGTWRGPETPKVRWGGFGAGIRVGAFETDLKNQSIKIASSSREDYDLIKSFDGTYKLIHRNSGNVLGSYVHIRDMISKDGTTKPVLRLPPTVKKEPVDDAILDTVRAAIAKEPPLSSPVPLANVPMVILPEGVTVSDPKTEEEVYEENLPQAARLLGFKYGPA